MAETPLVKLRAREKMAEQMTKVGGRTGRVGGTRELRQQEVAQGIRKGQHKLNLDMASCCVWSRHVCSP
jgi:hypothetical protein